MRLIKHIEDTQSFHLSGKYFIGCSKDRVRVCSRNDFELLNELSFERYPTVIDVGRDTFFLQDKVRLLELTYDLKEKRAFEVGLDNIWIVNWIEDNRFAMVKQEIDAQKDLFKFVRYDITARATVWEIPWDSYRFFCVLENHILLDWNKASQLHCLDMVTGDVIWKFDPTNFISEHNPNIQTSLKIESRPKQYKSSVIVSVSDGSNDNSYLFALDARTGNVMWHYKQFTHFKLAGNRIYYLDYTREYKELDPNTGKILRSADLSEQVHRMDLFAFSFYPNDDFLCLASLRDGRFGIIDRQTLAVRDILALPAGYDNLSNELVHDGNRMFLRAMGTMPMPSFFVYEL